MKEISRNYQKLQRPLGWLQHGSIEQCQVHDVTVVWKTSFPSNRHIIHHAAGSGTCSAIHKAAFQKTTIRGSAAYLWSFMFKEKNYGNYGNFFQSFLCESAGDYFQSKKTRSIVFGQKGAFFTHDLTKVYNS